jgi:tetrahydromethanopterin S-methyltransferase subunit E
MELTVLTGISVLLGVLNLLVLIILNNKVDKLQKTVDNEVSYRRKIMEILQVLIKKTKSKINYN